MLHSVRAKSAFVLAAIMSVGLAQPAWCQSLDGIFRQIPGLIVEEMIENSNERVIKVPAPVVIDAIPAGRCLGIQSALAALGFSVGTVDGQCGPRTRQAISAFQESLGAAPTGSLTDRQEQSLLAQGGALAANPQAQAPAPAPVATSVAAPASAPMVLDVLAGRWEGNYACGQGRTGLALTFQKGSGDSREGTFRFFPLPGNADVPAGEFEITAIVTSDDTISIVPGDWIDRPSGYYTVGLDGRLVDGGNTMEGQVNSDMCGAFEVARVAASVPTPPPVVAAPTPAPQPTVVPAPAAPAAPKIEPADTDIDCGTFPSHATADCEVFKQQAITVYFGQASAVPAIQRACRALGDGIEEAALVECLAGAYAAREYVKIPSATFIGGWKGLGPILDGTATCSALLVRIAAVAAAVTGKPVPPSAEAEQAQCQQLAMLAMSRQARPAWGGCAMGSDPDLAYLECGAPGSDQFKRDWHSAVAGCAGGKEPDALNRKIADAAASAGRQATTLSCQQVEDVALADAILTAEEIAGIRQDVADEIAAAAERERKQEEAEALARQRAEEERAKELAEQARLEAERAANPLYGALQAPDEYGDIARSIELGESFNFTDASMLFTAGVASELLENCPDDLDTASRVELAAFVAAASLQAGGGNSYSDPSIGDMMTDQAGSLAVFAAGITAARSMQCAGSADILGHIVDIVQDNKGSSDGGPGPFIASCSPVHGQASCTCLAELGRASYSNIYQMTYSRDLVYGILSNNPIAGMMIAMSCGIQNY